MISGIKTKAKRNRRGVRVPVLLDSGRRVDDRAVHVEEEPIERHLHRRAGVRRRIRRPNLVCSHSRVIAVIVDKIGGSRRVEIDKGREKNEKIYRS